MITSTGYRTHPEDTAFALIRRERTMTDPVHKVVSTPSCDAHEAHSRGCHRCRRALVLVVQTRERENREFRRLMGAPERGR